MFLKTLKLQDFRNYQNQSFDFKHKKIIFCGKNGKGKTNILEAISLLSIGKSWREKKASNLILNQENKISALITGKTEENNIFKILIEPKSRNFLRNDKKISRVNFLGQIPTLLFCPEFINLFSGNKSQRLQFFDRFLVQIYPAYKSALIKATKAHKQKTRLLRSFDFDFPQNYKIEQIKPWNKILIENLPIISQLRKKFIDQINPILQNSLQEISGKSEPIKLELDFTEIPTLKETDIEDFFIKNQIREIAAQKNFLSASRDDFLFFLRDQNITATASRGEERSVLLALLKSQKKIIEDLFQKSPILLLDDVFSELDDYRQQHLENITEGSQTFFTTTHKEHFDKFKSEVQVFEL